MNMPYSYDSASGKPLLATLPGALAIIVMLFSPHSFASVSLHDLIANDQLRARVSIDSDGELVQRASFTFSVEIATDRWFSRGTRVRDFRIPDAIVLPVSNFADNSSRRINGQTWSVQRWRFRVFPQNAGPLVVPQLRIFVSVNTATDGAVEGELTLNTTPVQITAPPGVENEETWIATPSLSIEDNWSGLLESYIPGDAITRTRSFVVQDVPAMMLEASRLQEIPGLSLYAAPAKVQDESNRGTLTGTREETLVITFENPGQYRIPGLDYLWFNTQTRSLETLSIPALDITVLATEVLGPEQPLFSLHSLAIVGTATTVLLLLLLLLLRHSRLLQNLVKALKSKLQRRRSHRSYLQALKQQDSTRCIALLYQHLARSGSSLQLQDALGRTTGETQKTTHLSESRQAPTHSLRLLLEHAYGKGSMLPTRRAANRLWSVIGEDVSSRDPDFGIQLNPASAPGSSY